MVLLALSREQFGDVLHSFVPVTVRVIAVLLVVVYAFVAWQRWAFYARPEQRAPRVIWVVTGVFIVLAFLIWRWL